jgi:hypothetical protein
MDALPYNLMVDEKLNLEGFDFEWSSQNKVSPSYVLFRACLLFYRRESLWLKNLESCPTTSIDFSKYVFKKLGLSISAGELKRFMDMENDFQKSVMGEKPFVIHSLGKKFNFVLSQVDHPVKLIRGLLQTLVRNQALAERKIPAKILKTFFNHKPPA